MKADQHSSAVSRADLDALSEVYSRLRSALAILNTPTVNEALPEEGHGAAFLIEAALPSIETIIEREAA